VVRARLDEDEAVAAAAVEKLVAGIRRRHRPAKAGATSGQLVGSKTQLADEAAVVVEADRLMSSRRDETACA
jgi:hypothetical protein